jgi:glyoxylase-like metal-dependent hydrolase (beta-lactamase superfamily II)
LIREGDKRRQATSTALRLDLLDGAALIGVDAPTQLDLGGRTVGIHPRRGHTPSDITVELADPSIVFCGDLVWNGLFPNYRDTIPTAFANSIRALIRKQDTVYVSGHGSLATGSNLEELLELVDSIGEIARQALEKGVSAEEAAATFQLPAAVADWVMFNPKYPEVAINAWYRELG